MTMNIEEIAYLLSDELGSANRYAKMALDLKPMAKEWAEKLYSMSVTELQHAMYLHDMAVELMESFKEEYDKIPPYASRAWDEIEGQYNEGCMHAKEMQAFYKG